MWAKLKNLEYRDLFWAPAGVSAWASIIVQSDQPLCCYEPSLKTICQDLDLPTKKDLYIIIVAYSVGIIAVFAVTGCPA